MGKGDQKLFEALKKGSSKPLDDEGTQRMKKISLVFRDANLVGFKFALDKNLLVSIKTKNKSDARTNFKDFLMIARALGGISEEEYKQLKSLQKEGKISEDEYRQLKTLLKETLE